MTEESIVKVKEVISKAYDKYKYLQEGDCFIEFDERREYIAVKWHTWMDGYINFLRIRFIINYFKRKLKGFGISYYDSISFYGKE